MTATTAAAPTTPAVSAPTADEIIVAAIHANATASNPLEAINAVVAVLQTYPGYTELMREHNAACAGFVLVG
jgi:hypothetical protein